MTVYGIFERLCNISYTVAENCASFATERAANTLYIYFEASNGGEDWKNNLDFPARPYRRMGDQPWLAHRGFLKVWKSAEPYIEKVIKDKSISEIVVSGYSHGGALAVLCYEYVWFHRPDLRQKLTGFGFGCPRVIYGFPSKRVQQRWRNFYVIRNIDDIVTHLPPRLMGFTHVGTIIEIGARGKYSRADAHRSENIARELRLALSTNDDFRRFFKIRDGSLC